MNGKNFKSEIKIYLFCGFDVQNILTSTIYFALLN